MSKQIEALKLALECIEAWDRGVNASDYWRDRFDAITAIREALTEPPAQQQEPLTDEEIESAMPSGIYDCLADPWDCGVNDGNEMRSIKKDVLRIARAIEAKLKEKNA